MAAESEFEKRLIAEIMTMFPGALLIKGNSSYIQGFPDRMLLWEDRWASLEVKALRTSIHQPNQDYYIEKLRRMSYANFIYPSNKEQVLNEIQQSFRDSRRAFVPVSQ